MAVFTKSLKQLTVALDRHDKAKINKVIKRFEKKYKVNPQVLFLKQLLIELNLAGFDLKWTPKEIKMLSQLRKSHDFDKEYPIYVVNDNGTHSKTSQYIHVYWDDSINKYLIRIKEN